mmetsp:Transcript_13140/g.43880  ORF Transcript_13140/g.43880 Transcript_13140/m.43880 type:complete len:296 (-) Transcript_13140:352-1239(-)
MNRAAHDFGAPVTVTAQVWHRNASSASNPSRRYPSTWSTVWMRREYISICRLPSTATEPGTQMRDLSLRSTSVHIVSSDSSLVEPSSSRTCEASSRASAPRSIVPEIGHVSTRSLPSTRSTRTNISGDAPTRYSPRSWPAIHFSAASPASKYFAPPRFIKNPYGDGLRFLKVRKRLEGGAGEVVDHCWERTTSKRFPTSNSCLAVCVKSAKVPLSMSRGGKDPSAAASYGAAFPSRAMPTVSICVTAPAWTKVKSYSTSQAAFSRWSTTRIRSGMKSTMSLCRSSLFCFFSIGSN